MYRPETLNAIQEIINHYNAVMNVMEHDAKEYDEHNERAYGGVVRATKGKLQEFITHKLIEIAWIHELQQAPERLEVNSKKIPIPMLRDYLNKLPDEVKKHISAHIDDYVYKLSVDKHIFIDGKFVAGIECKAYTENAMLKRILVDFMLLKTKYPELECCLFQLESQLGGDYSELNSVTFGSTSSHSIMSYFENVDLNIFTFIKGERHVDKPINKYFKNLEMDSLKKVVNHLCEILRKYTTK
ncbi:restriction endonuclease [Kingella kingae]|uniref:restriction endonuclease n=1 Tax=Kingella kingae TaxID=504 RepID=UPI0019D2FBA7|nr:restriction endonuclease [Kingella kingae]MDK4585906.1 restriction endonuclease [Kingella kingae]MDK4603907.1 restriction endonuclease [Kingella kingae]MDK4611763.1 restriction endonuclease [Kingella kingae]MDK4613885.1 restriction endonuclease [Kingella kingae]MDK4618145.1 restriction endonuclease [Kingella kingae]